MIRPQAWTPDVDPATPREKCPGGQCSPDGLPAPKLRPAPGQPLMPFQRSTCLRPLPLLLLLLIVSGCKGFGGYKPETAPPPMTSPPPDTGRPPQPFPR